MPSLHVEGRGEGVSTLWLYLTICRLCSGAVWPGPATKPHTAVQTKPEDLAAQLTRRAKVCQVSRRGDRSGASLLSFCLSAACGGLNSWALTQSNVWGWRLIVSADLSADWWWCIICNCWALVCHMDDDDLALTGQLFIDGNATYSI